MNKRIFVIREVLKKMVQAAMLTLVVACSMIATGLNPDAVTGTQNLYILTPVEGAILDGTVSIEADVRNIGIEAISRVEFYINGSLIYLKNLPPYKCSWDSTVYPDGPITIKVVISDINGGTAESSIVVNHYRGVYISIFGSDYNTGTREAPLRSIPGGIEMAKDKGYSAVYVSAGVYSPGSGLNASTSGIVLSNSDLKIIGGYNPMDFSSRTGVSELKGNATLNHLVYIENASNIIIDGFTMDDGNANGGGNHSVGGGMFVRYSRNITMQNCNLITNRASDSGGALYIAYCSNVVIDANISNNLAINYAGGVYCAGCTNIIFKGTISRNINTGSGHGGGLYINISRSVEINAVFIGNSCGNYGGAIMADGNVDCIISGSFISNYSANWGGAITIYNGSNYFIQNAFMTNNSSGNPNSVIYLVNNGSLGKITISNCVIGGSMKTPSYGIFENGTVDGHELVDNTFLSEYLGWVIYYDNSSSHIITNSGMCWTNLNCTNWTGALRASGNKVDRTNDTLYAADFGNDTYKGMRSSPKKTIQNAVTLANQMGIQKVYVAQGYYEPGSGLAASGTGLEISSPGLQLIGGYNGDYSFRTGVSELSGNGTLYHMIVIHNTGNIFIDGFYIERGYASVSGGLDQVGGGIDIRDGTNVTITNCTFFSNAAYYGGGGIYAERSSNISISAVITNNISLNGAGIYMNDCVKVVLRGLLIRNNSTSLAGGAYLSRMVNSEFYADIVSNTASSTAGGFHATYGFNNILQCNIINNYSGAASGGVYLGACSNFMIVNSVITNNYSTSTKTAVLFEFAADKPGFVISNNIIGSANFDGYGVYEYSGDLTGQVIWGNLFLTNTMTYLYHDVNGTNITVSTIGAGVNLAWSEINNRFVTGALLSSGNVVQ